MVDRKTTEARRNFRLAILLALVAIGFYVAFFFSIGARGH